MATTAEKKGRTPQGVWQLALVGAAATWGGSFVIIKDALDDISPCWLMCIRFALATLVLAVVLHRRLKQNLDASHLVAGAVLGLTEGLGYVAENIGLAQTTPGRNAFLAATYSVMVPFISWLILRKRPGGESLVAAVLGVAGVGMLSLGDDLSLSLGVGDWLSLLSGVFFALQIVFVAKFSSAHDVITLTVVQMAGCAVVSFVCALILEQPPAPSAFTPQVWFCLAYLVILASCVCFMLQNVGQAKVPPAQSALLLSLESVFAVICSVLFYSEVVTARMALGFALIFAAILVSELGGMFVHPRKKVQREEAG